MCRQPIFAVRQAVLEHTEVLSAKVTLDLIGGAYACLPGIATGLAQRSPLPKQIPALIERHLHSA